MGYEVTSCDGTVDVVEGADSYGQEGPLTTFFATAPGRAVVDSWSTRLASYRTADIARVRRLAVAPARPFDTTARAPDAGAQPSDATAQSFDATALGVTFTFGS